MMKNDQRVSIIIPTFNSGSYLRRCLQSMVKQTYPHIEIIIVDAGSKDDTARIVNEFSKKIRIIFLTLSPSTQSEARNLGISYSTGTYLSFCDSDDFYLPQKIEKQINSFKKNDIDVSFFDAIHFYSHQKKKFFLNQHDIHDDVLSSCIKKQVINLNTIMVSKAFILKQNIFFPEGEMGRYGEDGNFIFQLALHGARFKKLPENLSVVEVRNDSHTQWNAQWRMKYYAIQYLKEAKSKLKSDYYSLLEKSIRQFSLKLSIAYLIDYQFDNSKNTLKNITSSRLHKLIDLLFFLLSYLPSSLIRWTLTSFWYYRSKKIKEHSLILPPDIQTEINALI